MPSCEQETLAKGPVAKVQRCKSCGLISLHLGPTTVRLEVGAARSLLQTLQDALLVPEPHPAFRMSVPRGEA